MDLVIVTRVIRINAHRYLVTGATVRASDYPAKSGTIDLLHEDAQGPEGAEDLRARIVADLMGAAAMRRDSVLQVYANDAPPVRARP